jgi:hypothetical protein
MEKAGGKKESGNSAEEKQAGRELNPNAKDQLSAGGT